MDRPLTPHRLRTDCPRVPITTQIPHGHLSMDTAQDGPRIVLEVYTDCPKTIEVDGLSTDCPWTPHGLSMEAPRTVPGYPMNTSCTYTPRTVHGQPSDFPRTLHCLSMYIPQMPHACPTDCEPYGLSTNASCASHAHTTDCPLT